MHYITLHSRLLINNRPIRCITKIYTLVVFFTFQTSCYPFWTVSHSVVRPSIHPWFGFWVCINRIMIRKIRWYRERRRQYIYMTTSKNRKLDIGYAIHNIRGFPQTSHGKTFARGNTRLTTSPPVTHMPIPILESYPNAFTIYIGQTNATAV